MAIQKTEAIVIKTQPLRSSSLIVTLYTVDFGKMKGVAKGIRREREVRGALYELFTHLDIVFYEKKHTDLHLISEASILESHDEIRQHLGSIAYGSYFCELVDQVTELHDIHDSIFELLKVSLRYLPLIPPGRLARLFEVSLLKEVGWLPLLDRCLGCQKFPLEEGFFSIAHGGLVCYECRQDFSEVIRMDSDTLRVMRYFTQHSLDDALQHGVSKEVEKKLTQVIEPFLLYRLGHGLKSRKFLDSIKPVLTASP